MSGERADVAVIGAGVVGLAAALQTQRAQPALDITVLEAESRVAAHQSGHNSGVIHGGVYYQPGSLKARLCREGRAALLEFADSHAIPYRLDGMLIVAIEQSEHHRLDVLHERAIANGLKDVRLLRGDELREVEPHVAGQRALFTRESGVIDFKAVAGAYRDELLAGGATVNLGWPVDSVSRDGAGWRLGSHGRTVRARCVLSCAGLFTDPLLHMMGLTGSKREHRMIPFRGNYLQLDTDAAKLVRALIYPVPPDSNLPFLGVHLTRGIDDRVRAGPNAIPSLGRVESGLRRLRTDDLLDVLRFPGTPRLAQRYLRIGLGEMWRNNVRAAAVRRLRRYLPELPAEALSDGGGGVRAQCVARDGSLIDDFRVMEVEQAVITINAPSPAATASLAIGRVLAEKVIACLSATKR